MKFLLQPGKPAQECDYASSRLTAPALYLSHKHSPRCEYKRNGWGDAFSGAIKRPCASAYKTIGQIRLYRYPLRRRERGGVEGASGWINPPLACQSCVAAPAAKTAGLVKVDL